MVTQVKPVIEREILQNFNSQGRPGPGRKKWEELKKSTNKQRRLAGFPEKEPILQRKGDLKKDAVKVRMTFRGDTATIKPDVSGIKNMTKLNALHFGAPPAKVDAFGRTKGNVGKYTMRTSKKGNIFQWRLPTRPLFFITVQAWREIVRKGKRYFFG